MKSLNLVYSHLFVVLIALLLFSSCDTTGSTDHEVDIINETNVDLPAHEGEIGLVIDTREIFRKGYIAKKAEVTLHNFQDFNESLDVNPITNLAIFMISNEDLNDDQKAAFNNGISIDIVVFDEEMQVLAEYQDNNRVLDNSNRPLSLQTELPFIKRPLNLREGSPYLLQVEGLNGLIALRKDENPCGSCFIESNFEIDSSRQQFYFEPVDGEPDTYIIRLFGFIHRMTNKEYTYLGEQSQGESTPNYVTLWEHEEHALKFVLEQDEDGWMKIRIADTDLYWMNSENFDLIKFHNPDDPYLDNRVPSRFRIISDNINWKLEDRGTIYNAPIMPPTQIDFAYEARIRNCSPGIITETVGNTESRTSTRTMSTTESFEMFSSSSEEFEGTVNLTVGGEIYGVAASTEFRYMYSYLTSETTSTENTVSNSNEATSVVSRTRTLEVPPFSVIEVYDAVRTIKNVRTPYTQVLRLTGTYKNNAEPLSGPEIVTQTMFNFIEGVPSQISTNYVDITIRGNVFIDQMMEVETGADEIRGACD